MSNVKPYRKTYRVQGIPPALTSENTRVLLRSVLGEGCEPVIHSMGPDPHSPDRNPFQVATVTLGQSPRHFQDGKGEWTLPIMKYDHPGGETVPTITVDDHFLGFTPVNSVKDGPNHKIE
jgi:hypothetical protein